MAQTSSDNDESTQKIKVVEDQITKVQNEIETTQREINKVADTLVQIDQQLKDTPVDSSMWKYLVEKEKQLRDEKNKLHDKEKQLRDKENKLHDKEADLRKLLYQVDGKNSFVKQSRFLVL